MNALDPRIHAFRSDLADAALRGRVDAPRFVEGRAMRVIAPHAPLRREPSDGARLETEALLGERVTVFEGAENGWAWVQLAGDGYVGWMPEAALAEIGGEPTHRVTALRTFVFSQPDIKSAPLAALSLGALVTAVGEASDSNAHYVLVETQGAVVLQHLAAPAAFESDWTSVAERFVGVPYLWGGKTSLGLDCSALVQVALGACGVNVLRDSDMQAASIGAGLPLDASTLRRGDLVFWKGHVGIMQDAATLLHASGFHMAVVSEPLTAAMQRYDARGLQVTAIRRPSVAAAP